LRWVLSARRHRTGAAATMEVTPMAQARDVVERYYRAFDSKDPAWKDMITPDVPVVMSASEGATIPTTGARSGMERS